MAVSGTYNFNLDIDEVIQEASEMIGGESTLANEAASARRSINLMLKDWQNRGVLLWSTSTSSFTLTTSVTSYDLDSSTINALEVVISRSDRDNPTLSVWPIPENSTDTLKLEIVKELQDVNKSATQNADAPKRFLPALTCGLAYYMSMKRPLVPEAKIAMLKTNYEEVLARALQEDRETSSIYLIPRLTFYN